MRTRESHVYNGDISRLPSEGEGTPREILPEDIHEMYPYRIVVHAVATDGPCDARAETLYRTVDDVGTEGGRGGGYRTRGNVCHKGWVTL